MLVTGDWSLNTTRLVSGITGILTPAVVVFIARRLYDNLWHATIAGLVAATLPWFTDYSLWGVPCTLAGLLIALAAYAFVTEHPLAFGIAGALAVATAYEAWIAVFVIGFFAYYLRGWRGKKALEALGFPISIIALWSVWSIINSGSVVGWVTRYLAVIGWHFVFNSEESGLYLMQLLVPTFFFGLVAVAWGLYKGQLTRILSISVLALAATATLFHVIALDLGSPARLLPIYPILAALVPPVFPSLKGKIPRKTMLVIVLLIWLVIPTFAMLSQEGSSAQGPLPKRTYIMIPEYRTGLALKDFYKEGRVISDSAIVMYYSGLRPDLFRSSREIDWYHSTQDNSRLTDWLRANNVHLIVWERSNSSQLWQILPNLSDGTTHQLGIIKMVPVYEDTLAKRHLIEQQGGTTLWEHLYPGTPDLIIYQIQFNQ
jgi:hypothetical protein